MRVRPGWKASYEAGERVLSIMSARTSTSVFTRKHPHPYLVRPFTLTWTGRDFS